MKLILGGPGTGKTTRLLEILDGLIRDGIDPERIAFVSFTKKAVGEAVDRAVEKFDFDRKELPFFRTLHSLAYRELGLRRDQVLSKKHLKDFGDLMGVKIGGVASPEDWAQTVPLGDRMVYIDGLARATLRPLADVWSVVGESLEWFRLKQFVDALKAFKLDLSLIDFSDMLEDFLKYCGPVDVDVAIIDEAQDLTPLQWKVAELAFADVSEIYIAGDDDQAIYSWSGADVEHFMSLKADEKEVLPKSHRLPRKIFEVASSVISRVASRYAKDWEPRDEDGEVSYHRSLDGLDMTDGKSWLLLARNSHFLRQYEKLAESQGVVYTSRRKPSVDPDDVRAILIWERELRRGKKVSAPDANLIFEKLRRSPPVLDPEGRFGLADLGLPDLGIWHDALIGISLRRREYYLSVLRRGEKLLDPPKIALETIHSAKGGEADHVVLLTDMTKRTFESYNQEPDSEHRVFYVGATRARDHLHVILPTRPRAYQI